LRGGIDFASYHRQILLMGLFRARPGEVSGLRRHLVDLRAERLDEPEDFRIAASTGADRSLRLVAFGGTSDMFARLSGLHDVLAAELRAMTHPRWLRFVEGLGSFPIGINVRLGNDFKSAANPAEFFSRGALKTPLDWYVRSLNLIRRLVGKNVRALVVSDGSERELNPLLSLENVRFLRPGCAISDLLALSRCRVLLAAGGSSFSAWASFLGQMPTISVPGQSIAWFKLHNTRGAYLGDFDPDQPAEHFVEQLRDSFSGPTSHA